ncbi:hypothetical protein INR49_000960 [Caranx melampygus]|nr:hypothetical protein INR49_000960 [Caranx melampygus]
MKVQRSSWPDLAAQHHALQREGPELGLSGANTAASAATSWEDPFPQSSQRQEGSEVKGVISRIQGRNSPRDEFSPPSKVGFKERAGRFRRCDGCVRSHGKAGRSDLVRSLVLLLDTHLWVDISAHRADTFGGFM